MKVRIEGLPGEVAWFLKLLKTVLPIVHVEIISESQDYANRGSRDVRRYVDFEVPREPEVTE